VAIRLEQSLVERLERVSRNRPAALHAILTAGLVALLHRSTRAEEVVLGQPPVVAEGESPNPMLVLREAVAAGDSFRELLLRVRRTIVGAVEHQDYPVVMLAEELGRSTAEGENPYFDVAIQLSGLHAPDLARTVPVCMLFSAARDDAGIAVTVRYEAARYEASTARRIARHYTLLLERALADPDAPVASLDLRTSEEAELIATSNATEAECDVEVTIPELFARQAAATPDAVALMGAGRSVTYAELDRRANRLARTLRSHGVGPDDLVGVLAERSVELVVGILAVLKAGGAYLPLDPSYPAARLAYLLADSGARIVLAQARFADLVGEVDLIDLDAPDSYAADDGPVKPSAGARNLAYVIYTSGSTGQPKGVMVEHRSAVNRIGWMQRAYPIGPGDVVLQKTPISFDVSVWELFWWSFTGATLALLRPGGEKDPDAIVAAVDEHEVTVMHFVPSMLTPFLAHVERFGAAARLGSLRQVFSSGEELGRRQARRFAELIGHARLVNLYGPTETTVDVSYHTCAPGDRRARVPIGRPIDNTRLYVLDDAGRPAPVGVPGELYVGGIAVARGYLHREELTRERFLSGIVDGEDRVYRTGDLARWLPNGEVEYLGRIDEQVKVRGFRVEPGEIEERLRAHRTVRDAAVVAAGDGSGKYLRAHVVPRAPIDLRDLKRYLRDTLPEHMVPAQVVVLDALPLTPNGKLDWAALRGPSGTPAPTAPEPVAPGDEREATLARIWAEVLGVERVGVHDNFFALGGNSIHFVSVLAKARSAGLNFTFQQLFRHQTIAALAGVVVADGGGPTPAGARPFELLAPEDRAGIPAGVENAYPLSMLQAGLIYQTEITGGAGQYHDVLSYLIRGSFDAEAFERAVYLLVRRHPILRTGYHLTGYSEFIQMVHRDVPLPLHLTDLRGMSPEKQEQWHVAWVAREKARRFAWSEPGLVSLHVQILHDDLYRYSVSQHNSALDGWSISLLHTDLFDLYSRLRDAGPEGVPADGWAVDNHLRNFVALERQALASEESRDFWRHVLDGGRSTEVPRRPDAEDVEAFDVVLHDVPIPPGLTERVLALADALSVPVKNVLLAAHVKVLAALAGARDVLTGYEHSGRPELADAERALGLFLNTVPLRIAPTDGSWADLVRQVHRAEAELLPHRRYPMAKMKQDAGVQRPLFETVFNFTHFYLLKELRELSEFSLVDMRVDSQTEFVFRAEFSRHFFDDDVRLCLHYHPHLFDADQIERIGGYYVQALTLMTSGPWARHVALPLASEDELRTLRGFGEQEEALARYRDRVVGAEVARVSVLDEAGVPAPIGAPGEVVVHVPGEGAASGSRTTGLEPAGQADLLVRTGERGRWLPDGRLDILRPPVPDAPVPAPPDEPRRRADAVGSEASILERIASVWATVLDLPRDRIGPDDSFFELGGNSLSALRVVLELDGIISLTDLTLHPHLDELARLVRECDRDDRDDEAVLHLLSEPADDAAFALICFPYPSGHPINFRPLAEALAQRGNRVTVFGVEFPGHDPNRGGALRDVRETAELVVEEIAARVRTPISLWGQCGGAAVTLEVARLLEERGEDLRHVFIGSKLLPSVEEMRARIALVEGMSEDDIIRFMVDETGYTEMDGLDVVHMDFIARVCRHDVLTGYRYLVEASERRAWRLSTPLTCVVSAGDSQVAGHKREYRRWSLFAPDVRLERLAGSGHYFVRTNPIETSELVARAATAAVGRV
jgi:amino acid adenylation domain-containing protein